MTDPTPYDRRSPLEHERDAGPVTLQELLRAGADGVAFEAPLTAAVVLSAAADRMDKLEAALRRIDEESMKANAAEDKARANWQQVGTSECYRLNHIWQGLNIAAKIARATLEKRT